MSTRARAHATWRDAPLGFSRDLGNEQTAPLAAGQEFVGEWRRVGDHPGFVLLYASDVQPALAQIQWSKDGVNLDTSAFGSSRLTFGTISGLSVVFTVRNVLVQPWYRVRIVNGPTPQGIVYAFNAVLASPYTGTWSGVADPIAAMSVALLTRSVLIGDQGGGAYGPVALDSDRALQVGSKQIKDAGNALMAPPAAMPTPASPWVGTPFPTLAKGAIGTTFIVAGSPGHSGTVYFNYGPTAMPPAPVRVPLRVADLGDPVLVPLQNVDEFFWLEFEPDDDDIEWLAISCLHQKQPPPPLSRFLGQQVRDGEAVTHTRTFLSARAPDGSWPPIGFGQQEMAASLPVAIAADQPPVPVDLDGALAPTEAALAAVLAKLASGVALDAPSLAALESVDLNQATIDALAVPIIWQKTSLVGTGLPQTIKTGAGILRGILTSGSNVLNAFDDPGTGTLGQFLALSAPPAYVGPLDVSFSAGLRVTVQATKSFTVLWR